MLPGTEAQFPLEKLPSEQVEFRSVRPAEESLAGGLQGTFAGQVPSKAGVREGGAAAAGGCGDSRGKLPSLCKALW